MIRREFKASKPVLHSDAKRGIDGETQVVQYLPSKGKALISNPSPVKKKKKKKSTENNLIFTIKTKMKYYY
jgi:hypothetical protein